MQVASHRSNVTRISPRAANTDLDTDIDETLEEGQTLHLEQLATQTPYMAHEDMSAPLVYVLFSRAGACAVSVVSDCGAFRGIISRHCLIDAARRIQENHGKAT